MKIFKFSNYGSPFSVIEQDYINHLRGFLNDGAYDYNIDYWIRHLSIQIV